MNPYIEHEGIWPDFHQAYINAARIHLTRQVRPNYVVRVEAHLFLHEMPAINLTLAGRGDVSLSHLPHAPARNGGVALQAAPHQVVIPSVTVDEERIPYLEVLDRDGLEIVTVIELLSRSNKYAGQDRSQYLAKRSRLLASPANVVEIDLLRGGPRLPIEDLPECSYYAMVSRCEQRPRADLWPINLHEPLPTIPIPLKSTHADASLDLQALVHQIYDEADLETYLYFREPQPSLAAADAEWAKQFVPAAR
jgi:hypothetical protein